MLYLSPAFFKRIYLSKTEEVGFEPTKRFHVYTLSKRAPSATRTLLQKLIDWERLADFFFNHKPQDPKTFFLNVPVPLPVPLPDLSILPIPRIGWQGTGTLKKKLCDILRHFL